MKNKTKKKNIFIIITLVIVFAILFTGGIAIISIVSSDDYVRFDSNKVFSEDYPIKITDKFGTNLNKKQEKCKLNDLNDYTIKAFVAIEDRRFYSHNGVDVLGIIRATKNNLVKGNIVEGASTITQQLVKNTLLNSNKTFSRKINEMLLAQEIEQKYTKNEILEAYLNTIYFGNNAFGIENASKTYFDKKSKDLTLCESVALAGIINGPNNYSTINTTKIENRKNLVLSAMKECGFISEEDYNKCKNEKIKFCNNKKSIFDDKEYSWAVLQEACKILGVSIKQLNNLGVNIETYFDKDAQNSLRLAINSNIDKTQKLGIVIDNLTNGVKAFYGISNSNLYNIKRQIGSTIKPIGVYAPALDQNLITMLTPVLDENTNFNGYVPKNISDNYYGWTTIKEAVTKSLNVPAVKTMNMCGINKVRDYLTNNGITIDDDDNSLAMSLGGFKNGISLFELAQSYNTLAHKGVFNKISFIKQITDNKGNVIYKHDTNSHYVFSEESSFIMTKMLVNVSIDGTGKILKNLPYEVASKTGTVGNSEGNTDAIMCGYTTLDTFLIWNGVDNGRLNITGGKTSGEIALSLLENLYKNKQPNNFEMPNSIVQLSINKTKLDQNHIIEIADTNEKNTILAYFSKNNMPNKGKSIEIDKKQNNEEINEKKNIIQDDLENENSSPKEKNDTWFDLIDNWLRKKAR